MNTGGVHGDRLARMKSAPLLVSLLLFSACAGEEAEPADPYADLKVLMRDTIEAMRDFNAVAGTQPSDEALALACTEMALALEDIGPRSRAMLANHPELDENVPPPELVVIVNEGQAVGSEFRAHLARVMGPKHENEDLRAAVERLRAALVQMPAMSGRRGQGR